MTKHVAVSGALWVTIACGGSATPSGDATDGDTQATGTSADATSTTGTTTAASSSGTSGGTSPSTGTSGGTSTTAATTDEGSTGDEGRDLGPERDDFFGDSRCATAGVVFCDGFEDASIDTEAWEVGTSGSNTVEITTDQGARGGRSVHIHANDGFGYLRHTASFPFDGDRYWGRMFVRVDRFSTVDWAHWTLAEAAGTGDGSLIRVGGQYNTSQGANRWGVGSDGGATGDWTTHDSDPDGSPVEPPEDAWVCLEWLHDGQTDEALFFVDAVEHPSLATTSNQHGGNDVPSFESVWFGWWQYQSDPTAFDVWIDEIALDTERIGCKI